MWCDVGCLNLAWAEVFPPLQGGARSTRGGEALEEAFEVKCREADGDADELYRLAAARAYLASYIQAAT